jgi:hypothetical protein
MGQKVALEDYREMMWGGIFDPSRLSKDVFGHMIETDGVAASVHFKRLKSHHPPSSKPDVKTLLQNNPRVISIDPGRINIITAYERTTDNRDRFWCFSRRSYYQTIRTSLEKMRRWGLVLQDVYQEMSTYSLRTLDQELCTGYRRVYFEQYNRLWAVRLHKRWAREGFHIYSAKRSTLDKFFASFVKTDRRPPIILYGAAAVRSGGRGELSVPIKKVFETCSRFYTTVKVNEHLTTKCHQACGSRMHPIKRRFDRRPLHGLLYCPECKVFVNRDRNAPRNIMDIGMSEDRPQHLAFNRPYEYRRALEVLPSK